MTQIFILLFVLAVLLCQSEAQPSTVRPIRHSLPGILVSVNGSSSDGGCTPRDGSICNLQDGGTSVLFDNTILPLSGLDGNQWARDLFILRRPGNTFLSIGFDFGTAVPVRRVELVLFNCQEWSIRASDIQIHVEVSVNGNFPRPDPTILVRVGNRLCTWRAGDNNLCEDLYRVCLPTLLANHQMYYIVFPNAVESDWMHLAEVTFYNDTDSCAGREIPVTEPTTPQVDTTTEAGPLATPTQPTTTNQESNIQSTGLTPTNQQSTIKPTTITLESSLGIILGVVISTVVVTLTLVVIIILVAILCWTKRHQQLSIANEIKEPVYETIDDQGGVLSRYDVPVFNNGGTASKQTIEMTANTAYGRVAIGDGPNELYDVIHDNNTTDPDKQYEYMSPGLNPYTEVVRNVQMPNNFSARNVQFEVETRIA